ncbi:MAG: hypothetical protein QXL15_02200 [Candidatus Korarchaeota archaeon]
MVLAWQFFPYTSVMIVTGLMMIWRVFQRNEEYKEFFNKIGVILGIVNLIAAGILWATTEPTPLVQFILLIIIGIAMALKPVEEVSLASLAAVAAGFGVGGLASMYLPQSIFGYTIDYKWYVGIGLFSMGIVFLILRVIENAVKTIIKIVNFPVFSIIFGGLAILEGGALLFNTSVIGSLIGGIL